MKGFWRVFLLLIGCILIAAGVGCERFKQPAPLSQSPENSTNSSDSTSAYEFPKPTGFVNDFANVLNEQEEAKIEVKLKDFQGRSNVDIAVALVPTTDGQSVSDYSLEMAKQWKIGSENGGALLLVAVEDRQWRIQIDKKLELILPSIEVKAIGETMTPDLKEKKYADAVEKCVDKFIAELTKKGLNAPAK